MSTGLRCKECGAEVPDFLAENCGFCGAKLEWQDFDSVRSSLLDGTIETVDLNRVLSGTEVAIRLCPECGTPAHNQYDTKCQMCGTDLPPVVDEAFQPTPVPNDTIKEDDIDSWLDRETRKTKVESQIEQAPAEMRDVLYQAEQFLVDGCPQCGSTFYLKLQYLAGGGERIVCSACGYSAQPGVERVYEPTTPQITTDEYSDNGPPVSRNN